MVMPGTIDQRLAELKLELPNPASPMANYVPAVRSGNLLFLSGQICQWNGERRFLGKLGAEISVEQGREAAKLCGLNLLAQAKRALDGDLDRVVRVVGVNALGSAPDETLHCVMRALRVKASNPASIRCLLPSPPSW